MADGPIYYIQAEEEAWDYVPSGLNLCRYPGVQAFEPGTAEALAAVDGLGSVFKKSLYVEYTDASFTVSRGNAEMSVGGPRLSASGQRRARRTLGRRRRARCARMPASLRPSALHARARRALHPCSHLRPRTPASAFLLMTPPPVHPHPPPSTPIHPHPPWFGLGVQPGLGLGVICPVTYTGW